jgi:hypothetical protein
MKSMSIADQGRSRLNCVCRCANGLRRSESPPIHMRDGENVCIQRTSPAQAGSALASRHTSRTASADVARPLKTKGQGTASDDERPAATALELEATVFRGPGP